jgi:hypothetical protein
LAAAAANFQKVLAFAAQNPLFGPSLVLCGLVAQLEERLNGIEEVVSSNLIGSTNFESRPSGDGFRI